MCMTFYNLEDSIVRARTVKSDLWNKNIFSLGLTELYCVKKINQLFVFRKFHGFFFLLLLLRKWFCVSFLGRRNESII